MGWGWGFWEEVTGSVFERQQHVTHHYFLTTFHSSLRSPARSSQIEAERRRLADVEKRITRAKTAIVQRRKQIAQTSRERKNAVSANRNLCKLENKLQQLLVKNNLMEKDNKRRKKQVDDLRMEKMQQMQVTSKFERGLAAKRAKIAGLVGESQEFQDKKEKVRIDEERSDDLI